MGYTASYTSGVPQVVGISREEMRDIGEGKVYKLVQPGISAFACLLFIPLDGIILYFDKDNNRLNCLTDNYWSNSRFVEADETVEVKFYNS